MRIIAGRYRGRRLVAPSGRDVTRPTTDRVRESLMSVLASARGGFDGAVVLDAFAGSGALGIEAVSRGARHAVLCDTDREALAACRKNVALLDAGSATVARADVARRVPACAQGPYDVVFLDPPYLYAPEAVADLVARMDAAGLLAPGALIAYEHGAKRTADFDAGIFTGLGLAEHARKTYGKTVVDIFRKDVQ